jgi:hypothetical protein
MNRVTFEPSAVADPLTTAAIAEPSTVEPLMVEGFNDTTVNPPPSAMSLDAEIPTPTIVPSKGTMMLSFPRIINVLIFISPNYNSVIVPTLPAPVVNTFIFWKAFTEKLTGKTACSFPAVPLTFIRAITSEVGNAVPI